MKTCLEGNTFSTPRVNNLRNFCITVNRGPSEVYIILLKKEDFVSRNEHMKLGKYRKCSQCHEKDTIFFWKIEEVIEE